MAKGKIKINKNSIKKSAMKELQKRGSKAQQQVHRKAKRVFEQKKKRLLKDFDSHPVTRELQAGASSSNSSGTLGGYGNLYSFIGFDRGSDPIGSLRRALISNISLSRRPKIKKTGRGMRFDYQVRAPSQRDLIDATPMPWEPGSWAMRIEKGISGLGYYIYQNFTSGSRSGKGKQSKKQINKGVTYKRTTYMSKILRDFIRSRK